MTAPSPVPTRMPSGISTDFPWQPLKNYGNPNPFKYYSYQDDFLGLDTTATTGDYIATAADSGALALVAKAPGGQIIFTPGATTLDIVALTPKQANFILPALPKRAF